MACPSKTVWIAGHLRPAFNFRALCKNGVPLINGSNTNFSQPFVLTYPNNGFPTDKPRPQLVVLNMTGFSDVYVGWLPQPGRHHQSNQLWGATTGVLP